MESRPQWLDWAVELQALAQAGLEYGHDKFDLERYARIREISAEIMAQHTGLPLEEVRRPQMVFCMKLPCQVPPLSLLRRKADLSP